MPITALSLVNDDWQFLNQSVCFDAAFLDAMAKLADTPKEQRGDWSNYKLKYDMDFDGTLNLLDFIDYEALGRTLIEAWYFNDCSFKTDNGEIVTTEIGW